MKFRELLQKDLDGTFYNTEEFAEEKGIKYDGEEYHIPAILDLEEMKEYAEKSHAEGIHKEVTVLRVRSCDMPEPRVEARMRVNQELFNVENCREEFGEYVITLARYSE